MKIGGFRCALLQVRHNSSRYFLPSHAKKLQSCFAHHLTTVASAPQNNDLLLFKNSLCSSPFPKLSSPKLLISHPSHFFCSASPLKPRVKDKLGKKAIYWQSSPSPSSTPSSCSSWGDVDDSVLVIIIISYHNVGHLPTIIIITIMIMIILMLPTVSWLCGPSAHDSLAAASWNPPTTTLLHQLHLCMLEKQTHNPWQYTSSKLATPP